MKFIVLLILSLTLTSCGQKRNTGGDVISPPNVGVGAISVAETNSYLNSFLWRMSLSGNSVSYSNLSISSEDISTTGVLGQCTIYRNSSNVVVARRVTIDIPYWNILTKADKEELMYHELGHCILLRGHNDSETIPNIPDSIMHSYHLGQDLYLANYVGYIEELFGVASGVLAGIGFNAGDYASTLASHSNLSVEESNTLLEELSNHSDHCVHNVILVD